jgi:hypothetical protein
MIRPLRALLPSAVVLCATFPGLALPADPPGAPAPAPADAAGGEGRVLNGHAFMPVLGMVTPFATTSFGTFLTLGTGSTKGTITLQVPGNPPPPPQTFTGDVSFAAVGGALGYEYAVFRGVGVRAFLNETIYSGTTGAAAAVVGTNARVGLGAGITAGMTLGEAIRVAGVLDVTYAPRFGLILGPAVAAAYDSCQSGLSNCQFDFDKLFEQENILEVVPGVAASWAPMRALGVSANVSYSHSSIDTSGSGTRSQDGMKIGAAVDFDFREISRAAVGLQLAYGSFVPFGGEEAGARYTDLGGGVFYTGRRNLALGPQFTVRRFRVAPQVDVSWQTVVAVVGLRYYW